MVDEIGGVARILVAPLLRQRVPRAPVERKHAMENPPALERLWNVGVAHFFGASFVLAAS